MGKAPGFLIRIGFNLIIKPKARQNNLSLTPHGNYDVKTAYDYLSSSKNLHSSKSTNWKEYWRLNIPNKILMFWWKTLHGGLPLRHNLTRRGFRIDNDCPFGCLNDETDVHLFKERQFAKMIWFGSSFMIVIDQINQPSIIDWIDCQFNQALQLKDDLMESLVNQAIIICWSIYTQINQVIFQNAKKDPLEAIHRVVQVSQKMSMAVNLHKDFPFFSLQDRIGINRTPHAHGNGDQGKKDIFVPWTKNSIPSTKKVIIFLLVNHKPYPMLMLIMPRHIVYDAFEAPLWNIAGAFEALGLDALPIPRSRSLVLRIYRFRDLDALLIPRGLDALPIPMSRSVVHWGHGGHEDESRETGPDRIKKYLLECSLLSRGEIGTPLILLRFNGPPVLNYLEFSLLMEGLASGIQLQQHVIPKSHGASIAWASSGSRQEPLHWTTGLSIRLCEVGARAMINYETFDRLLWTIFFQNPFESQLALLNRSAGLNTSLYGVSARTVTDYRTPN
ncbi:reverse transcriptase [Senna tora]|uniref:Reverse transcriptase n=1 Tax=Senna tora TaxID=362788 RepID=A0A834WTJ9_9FABA|nr:reverse transcriptase [Senna tora]